LVKKTEKILEGGKLVTVILVIHNWSRVSRGFSFTFHKYRISDWKAVVHTPACHGVLHWVKFPEMRRILVRFIFSLSLKTFCLWVKG